MMSLYEVHCEGLIPVCFVCSQEEGCHRGILEVLEVRRQGNNQCQITLEVLLPQTPHIPACLALEDLQFLLLR